MSLCIVHVGMYKTGTTSIQRSFHGYSDERFAYADAGHHSNHSQIIFRLLGAAHSLARYGDEAVLDAALSRFRQSMAAARGRTYLISGEGIINLPPEKLEELRRILLEYFDEVRIAAAIRPPASFMASALQTRIKRRSTNRLGRIARYRPYRASFEKFDEVFGRSNVILWKYDTAAYPGGCAVRDFCVRFGINLPPGRIVRANESLSREALGLLFIYRRVGVALGSTSMTAPQNYRLAQALSPIGQTRFRIAPDLVRKVLRRHPADIEWMQSRLGQSLREDLTSALPGDVRTEDDLLQVQPNAVSELLGLLGKPLPKGNAVHSPREVAELVHALREKAEAAAPTQRRGNAAERLMQRVGIGGR